MRIVVVGAGIVGASVAYHCARAGAGVTLLDAEPSPAAVVTGASFAWIGGPTGRDAVDGRTPLHRSALEDHRRLERDVPGVRVRWCGSLTVGGPVPDAGGLGPDEEVVDADAVRRLEPHLRAPQRALWRPTDAAVDPVATTTALVRAAKALGARVRLGQVVLDLEPDGRGGVRCETSDAGARDVVTADAVVLAAGTGVPALCAPLGVHVPVTASPAALMRVAASPGLVRGIVVTPGVEVREAPDGGLLATLGVSAESGGGDLERSAGTGLRRLRDLLDLGSAEVLDVRLGLRPMPADGLPVVGPLPGVPGVHLAVLHAGVTLAPTVGRLVAGELVGGVRAPELAGVRPGRVAQPGTATVPGGSTVRKPGRDG